MAVLRYSVIRYVPDPRREEYINVGVLVAADDGSFIDVRFTSNWQRVQHFGQEDLGFLQEFARLMRYRIRQRQEQRQPLIPGERLDSDALAKMATDWHNSIQFSSPRASVAPDPRILLDQLFSTYIVEARPQKRKLRTKQEIVSLAQRQLEAALRRSFAQDAPRVIKDDFLMGAAALHELDLVVRNGAPLLGIEGISFQRVLSDELQHLVQSTAFVIEDVKEANANLPMAVVVIPPDTLRSEYDRALRIYEKIGAAVVVEQDLPGWVDRTVQEFSARLANGHDLSLFASSQGN